MKTLKTVWYWIVLSSADPEKTSLMVKGFLVGMVPFFLILAPTLGITVSYAEANDFVGQVTILVLNLLTIAGLLTASFGLIRKVGRTMTGTNETLV